jgi:hypothetical protein
MTNWKISTLDRNTSDGFVQTVHWTASQINGDFTASTYSTASFNKKDGINYVPYAELTEAAVIGWVQSVLGAEGVAAVDASLAAQIAEQKAPKKAAGLPWA